MHSLSGRDFIMFSYDCGFVLVLLSSICRRFRYIVKPHRVLQITTLNHLRIEAVMSLEPGLMRYFHPFPARFC